MKTLIAKIRNTNHFENIKNGTDLERLLYKLVNEAEKADKELDTVHQCLTEIYNISNEIEVLNIIRNMLKEGGEG